MLIRGKRIHICYAIHEIVHLYTSHMDRAAQLMTGLVGSTFEGRCCLSCRPDFHCAIVFCFYGIFILFLEHLLMYLASTSAAYIGGMKDWWGNEMGAVKGAQFTLDGLWFYRYELVLLLLRPNNPTHRSNHHKWKRQRRVQVRCM